jgi:hypothetical protein
MTDELLLVFDTALPCAVFPESVAPFLSVEQSEPELGEVGIRE